ncbi:MAG: UvrB/UvrC motif-containing protein [Planctomycetaceae bacterium]|jgi:protein arginine kinase activator|nr:UvrB/UvrC motif-containing protein [Planctomycetaceae bacterium]
MKCQKCNKPAMFHITELTGDKPEEHHFCELHAREYLNESSQNPDLSTSDGLAMALADNPVKKNPMTKLSAELQAIDQQICPICGISFYDFRNRGRLGCANDYDCFAKQLEPLIANIHGATTHIGKSPIISGSNPQPDNDTNLIGLRRELDVAVSEEDYERASRLRDEIKKVENS